MCVVQSIINRDSVVLTFDARRDATEEKKENKYQYLFLSLQKRRKKNREREGGEIILYLTAYI